MTRGNDTDLARRGPSAEQRPVGADPVPSPKTAAEQRLGDLEPVAREYDRLVAALLILAEDQPQHYQEHLWAKYVAGRSSRGRDASSDDSSLAPPGRSIKVLLELLEAPPER